MKNSGILKLKMSSIIEQNENKKILIFFLLLE